MNPVHAISDILEHALVGHEKVTIFEASLTTTGNGKKSVINLVLFIKRGIRLEYYSTRQAAPCVSGAVTEEINQAGKEVSFCREHESRECFMV